MAFRKSNYFSLELNNLGFQFLNLKFCHLEIFFWVLILKHKVIFFFYHVLDIFTQLFDL